MSIKDIKTDDGKGIDYIKVMNVLNQAINSLDSSIDSTDKSKGIGYNDSSKDKRMITIKNPESLNGKGLTVTKGWNVEYQGRDLSLTEDNYRWDVWSDYSGGRGYYIIERELVQGDWLNVRWGKLPTNVKERKETIHKDRLKDKSRIQRDMIQAINHSIGYGIKPNV